MKVHISAEAQQDLEAIGDYIARDNPERAISFLEELRGKCLALGERPEAFPLVERYAARGVRRCLHGKYLIFYIVEDDKLAVLHILHGARDYGAMLF